MKDKYFIFPKNIIVWALIIISYVLLTPDLSFDNSLSMFWQVVIFLAGYEVYERVVTYFGKKIINTINSWR